jgi:SPP1 gp7 family putative phage head morphogenesis protein
MNIFQKVIAYFGKNPHVVEIPQSPKQAYLPLIQATQYLYRIDIKEWTWAEQEAIHIDRPRRTRLMEVYRVVGKEAKAKTQKRILNVLNIPFKVIDTSTGETDEQASLLLKKSWMHKFLAYAIESKFYGYSLVKLIFNAQNNVVDCQLVPRENIIPEYMGVLIDTYSEQFTRFDLPPYTSTYIWICEDTANLGLFNDLATSAIAIKNARAFWGRYQELFGISQRIATTSSKDDKVLNQIENNLKNMASAGYAVLPEGTEYSILADGRASDPFKVFQEAMHTGESRINDVILGSPQGDNNAGSYAKEKVYKEVAEDIAHADIAFCQAIINDKLLPILNLWNYDFEDREFAFDLSWSLPLATNQLEIDKWLSETYTLPTDYILRTYGVPVSEIVKSEVVRGEIVNNTASPLHQLATSPLHQTASYNNWMGAIEEFLKDVHRGKIKPEDLNETLFFAKLNEYKKAMEIGTGANWLDINWDKDYYKMYEAMRSSLFKFTAASTYQELKEIQNLLYEAGKPVSLQVFKARIKEFVEKANQIDRKYSETWLTTEYNYAINQSQNNARWLEFENNADLYPNLKYVAVDDERVRADHKMLDGIIKPIGDEFWDIHSPQNGWNCRCRLVATKESANEPTNGLPDIPKEFNTNTAKEGIIFPDAHPYFDIPAGEAEAVRKRTGELFTSYNKMVNEKIYKEFNRPDYTKVSFDNKTGGFLIKHNKAQDLKPHEQTTIDTLIEKGYRVVLPEYNTAQSVKNFDVEVNGASVEMKESTKNTQKSYEDLLKSGSSQAQTVILQITGEFDKDAFMRAVGNKLRGENKKSLQHLILLIKGKLHTLSQKDLQTPENTRKALKGL